MTLDQTLITQNPFAKRVTEELFPTATIIYHADAKRIGEETPLFELKHNRSQDISRLTPEFSQPESEISKSIADPYISRKPLQLTPLNGGLHIRKPSELTGNVTANGRLLVNELFIVGDEWRKGVVISMSNRVVLFLHHSPQNSKPQQNNHGLLGDSAVIRKLRQVISRVSDLQVPVLIRGETGTGKELVAQAIHNGSQRKKERFVSVNVAAIPESLAISELFGSKKGAFTGATKDRAGYFQQADKSTLFLDEIGDAQEQIQVALLRTLETGDVTPVGSSSSIHVDVRLVAATDADLEKSVLDERFRSPLLQRLAGFEIRIPPLRQRREDVGRLLIHFLSQELNKVNEIKLLENTPQNVSFWAGLFTKACLYDWPGNIRQLINIAQQVAIYNRDVEFLTIPDHIDDLFSPKYTQPEVNSTVSSHSLPPSHDPDRINADIAELSTNNNVALSEPSFSPPPLTPSRRKPSSVSEHEIISTLEQQLWDLKATAEALNISRAALYKIIEKTSSIRTASDYSVDELREAYQRSNGNLEFMVSDLKVSKAALKRRLKDLRVE